MRKTIGITLAAASALLLTGCGTAAAGTATGGGRVEIVASTDVYGSIAAAVGGDAVDVTSLIDSPSKDPHDFEATARDQLAVSRADIVVQNGGGYDPFVASLLQSSGSQATVVTAVEYSDAWVEAGGVAASASPAPDAADAAIDGFNEHVFYDTATMQRVAEAIGARLVELRPDQSSSIQANEKAFTDQIATLEGTVAAMRPSDGGRDVFVTEPVPLYLTTAAGLTNVAPPAFTQAVEEGNDVPPATLLESLGLISGGTVDVVIVNAQTGGGETQQVIDAADAAKVPVMKVTETLPEGKTYIQWMTDNVDALEAALAG